MQGGKSSGSGGEKGKFSSRKKKFEKIAFLAKLGVPVRRREKKDQQFLKFRLPLQKW